MDLTTYIHILFFTFYWFLVTYFVYIILDLRSDLKKATNEVEIARGTARSLKSLLDMIPEDIVKKAIRELIE